MLSRGGGVKLGFANCALETQARAAVRKKKDSIIRLSGLIHSFMMPAAGDARRSFERGQACACLTCQSLYWLILLEPGGGSEARWQRLHLG